MQALAQLIACEIHPLNNLRVLNYLRDELKHDEAGVGTWYRTGSPRISAGSSNSSAAAAAAATASATLSLADVCLVPQMFNARRFNTDLTPFPTLVRIAAGLEAEPAFAAAGPPSTRRRLTRLAVSASRP